MKLLQFGCCSWPYCNLNGISVTCASLCKIFKYLFKAHINIEILRDTFTDRLTKMTDLLYFSLFDCLKTPKTKNIVGNIKPRNQHSKYLTQADTHLSVLKHKLQSTSIFFFFSLSFLSSNQLNQSLKVWSQFTQVFTISADFIFLFNGETNPLLVNAYCYSGLSCQAKGDFEDTGLYNTSMVLLSHTVLIHLSGWDESPSSPTEFKVKSSALSCSR